VCVCVCVYDCVGEGKGNVIHKTGIKAFYKVKTRWMSTVEHRGTTSLISALFGHPKVNFISRCSHL